MKKLQSFGIIGLLAVVVLFSTGLLSGCKKDTLFTGDAELQFSVDTLTFDTVFTTLGSITLGFKAFNPYDQPIKIDRIYLEGLQGSTFRINVNGVPGNAEDIEVDPEDSLYVFVEATLGEGGLSNPFVLHDHVHFITNGNDQTVTLLAWGQDAYFHYGEVYTGGTWATDKPHVLVGGRNPAFNDAFIPGLFIPPGQTLDIPAGTHIYAFNNAGLYVDSAATLNINGACGDSVTFEGHRLEPFFDDLPGQWQGIFVLRNGVANISHADVNESTNGITVGSAFFGGDCSQFGAVFDYSSKGVLNMDHVRVRNTLGTGIYGFNSDISAENCIVTSTADNGVTLGIGGNYTFDNCTFEHGGSTTVPHDREILFVSNGATCESSLFIGEMHAAFTNCIVYGSLDEETAFNYEPPGIWDVNFDHCLIKTEGDTLGTSNIYNMDPLFADRSSSKLNVKDGSPAIDAGTPNGLIDDYWCNPRPMGATYDIGAFERVP